MNIATELIKLPLITSYLVAGKMLGHQAEFQGRLLTEKLSNTFAGCTKWFDSNRTVITASYGSAQLPSYARGHFGAFWSTPTILLMLGWSSPPLD